MSIGQPLRRLDGHAKVTGSALYTADRHPGNVLYAALVTAIIPAGKITVLDASVARSLAGITHVLTHRDMPRFADAPSPPLATRFLPMQGEEIRYEGQPVAIVLGETLEAAEHGARMVRVEYAAAPFQAAGRGEATDPGADSAYAFAETQFRKGDFETAFEKAAKQFEATYVQPSRHHNPMETSATVASWDGDALTVYDAVQHGYGVQFVLASVFGMDPKKIRIIAPYTGGGFGSKGYVWPHQVLIPAAARVAKRPVKLMLSRSQMYSNVGYQPRTIHEMAIGTTGAGCLTGIRHHVTNLTDVSNDYIEFATAASKALYSTPTMDLRQRIERANVNTPTAMRAPVEGPGTWALESAMDEVAHSLGIDPLDLRLSNYAEADPSTGKPWSSKKLREAYEEGARLFGWRERPRTPPRDGNWVIGYGMASCTMSNFRLPSVAQVRLFADGTAAVEAGFHEIGTGTVTIFAQIAADVLGIDPGRVTTRHGDTNLPQAGPTYGSSSTMGVGSAVLRGAEDIRAQLARAAGLSPVDLEASNGELRKRGAGAGVPLARIMEQAGLKEMVGEGRFSLPNNAQFDGDGSLTPYAMRTFGAIFLEVGVDPELGLLRLRRAVGSYSAGRIINPRTARAQMTGGIIWGWGMAAMEGSEQDPRLGRWLSKNLSGVAIPVHADIPGDILVHFVDEFDEHASPLGAKGIGELGATGAAAAVANAVFSATGKRIRELPITPAKLVS
jgi:xanthine dehydrogenase YagR molybdenum-binding subunit